MASLSLMLILVPILLKMGLVVREEAYLEWRPPAPVYLALDVALLVSEEDGGSMSLGAASVRRAASSAASSGWSPSQPHAFLGLGYC